jgi:phosphoglycolate phosphatase-like HAD superfamily hydrolase
MSAQPFDQWEEIQRDIKREEEEQKREAQAQRDREYFRSEDLRRRVYDLEREAEAGKIPQPEYPPGSFERGLQREFAQGAAERQRRRLQSNAPATEPAIVHATPTPSPAPTPPAPDVVEDSDPPLPDDRHLALPTIRGVYYPPLPDPDPDPDREQQLDQPLDEPLDDGWGHWEKDPGVAHTPEPPPFTDPATYSPNVRRDRRNLRLSELRAIHRHTTHGVRWEAWFASLCACFGNRDPLSEEQVSPQELANVLGLTLAQKDLVEAKEIERKRKRGLFDDDDQQTWSIRTIGTSDMPKEQRDQIYRRRRYERRKAKRQADRIKQLTEDKMTLQQLNNPDATCAERRAARVALTRAQLDDLIEAIRGRSEARVAELMVAVRPLPLWQGLDERRLYQTIITRLNTLRDQNLITERSEPGPRGLALRIVRATTKDKPQ